MESLEIQDGLGDVLFISPIILPFDHMPQLCSIVNITIHKEGESRNESECVQVNKSDALQIIAHLKQCFNI